MLEKILDKYYAKKLIKQMQSISLNWFLDFEFKIKKDKVIVSIKREKYKDKWYRDMMLIKSTDYLSYLCDYEKLRRTMTHYINRYLEIERNK